MTDTNSNSTSQDDGYTMFDELANRLARFVLSDEIELGRIRGIGGYADVYEAKMRATESTGWTKVAVKRFRTILENDEKFASSLKREVLIWKNLNHKNVLSFLGMAVIDGVPCMVSEWMNNGTMVTYLENHTDVDVLALVHGIACGLEYLHNSHVVHSDLKGDNVLIADDGRALLADFGISRLLVDSITIAGTTTLRGNTRWMAPELIDTPEGCPNQMHTKASDVWAFGMVAYQVLSGKLPYYERNNEVQVIIAITGGKLPTKPDHPSVVRSHLDLLWQCCDECWINDPAGRPTIGRVRESLESCDLQSLRTFTVEEISSISANECWISTTGRFIVAIMDGRDTLSIFDSRSMAQCGHGLRLDYIRTVAWPLNEEHIVTLSSGILRKWTNIYESPTLVAESTENRLVNKVKFSPDGKFIVSFDGTARLWDASDLTLICQWENWGYCISAMFHPSGNRIVFYNRVAFLNVDIEDLNSVTATVLQSAFTIFHLRFDPSGKTCIVKTDRDVKILRSDTFEVISSLPYIHANAMRITPNGKYILSVLRSKVSLWDITAGEAVEELTLDVDLEKHGSVDISRNCRALCLSKGIYLNAFSIIHLKSTYY